MPEETTEILETPTVPSLCDLMHEAYCLSLDLCFSELTPTGTYFTPRNETLGTKQQSDQIWAWCDGLIQAHYERMATGRCSLQSMIDFDLEKFENGVKADIAMMKALQIQFPLPITLTSEEMTRRGYRGY